MHPVREAGFCALCPAIISLEYGSRFRSQVIVRREPSRVASIAMGKALGADIRTFNQGPVTMRARRIFLNFALTAVSGITLQSTAFSQDYRGTWEQQRACTPDVWRLCGSQIPDVGAGSWLACSEIPRNSAIGAARSLHNAPSRAEDRGYGQRRHDRDYGSKRYDRDYGPKGYDREYGPRRYDYDDE